MQKSRKRIAPKDFCNGQLLGKGTAVKYMQHNKHGNFGFFPVSQGRRRKYEDSTKV